MYTIKEIAKILNAKLIGKGENIIFSLIFDSRMIIPRLESLFFAFQTSNNNGQKYISTVYKKGIRNFVVDRNFSQFDSFPEAEFIVVNNTTEALQQLATFHRRKYNIPVFAVTGSNGKTIVKEWLSFFLSIKNSVLKSPKSYNSQIGVPLSVWELSDVYDVAVFEAGISKNNEMMKLEKILKPTISIITNIGDAHQENFKTLKSKIIEKSELFKDSELIIYSPDFELIDEVLSEKYPEKRKFTWSLNKNADLKVLNIKKNNHYSIINLVYKKQKYSINIKFDDRAFVENTLSVLSALLCFYPENNPNDFDFTELPSVEMRLQQIEGKNNCTIINDSYNCDISSLRIALDVLTAQNQNLNKTIILSDIFEVGKNSHELYTEIAQMLKNSLISKIIGVGESISANSDVFSCEKYFFKTTNELINEIDKFNFSDETILLKGARKFHFENIAEVLQLKNHRTVLEINMSSFDHNLNYFRSLLKPTTKLMIMVKAFSYGSGSFEIANFLQRKNVDYLAVAIADEGIALRKAGITLPILILNPDIANFELFVEYSLEPEIYSFRMLDSFYKTIKNNVYNAYPIHLKFNTGMNRLGFDENNSEELIEKLKRYDKIYVKSVFSHLVGSSEKKFDDFTKIQIEKFKSITLKLEKELGYKFLCHILNSGGIERFKDYQFDMVRLGIGLYGISSINNLFVKNISSLKTRIIQTFNVKKNETVGYSRAWRAHKDSKIATLPIGYADGLDRRLSNGVGEVFIKGNYAPIVGNICMDLTMIDITDIEVGEGDEVIIFGKDQSITKIAEKLNTIAYEVLTSISSRVKRIYVWE